MLLRVEDIDRVRCKPEFVEALFEDLQWLGLRWPEPVMYQSERFAIYRQAADRLRAEDLLYPCFCSRRAIAENAVVVDPDGAPLYSGTCRHLSQELAAARLESSEQANWRLDMQSAVARCPHLQIAEFSGEEIGEVSLRAAEPALWGDVVLVRKDTPTSYHLSVVVDDAAQRVTHVVRGRDLWRATDIHRLLQALLRLPSPIYFHHDLLRDESNEKLAKSRGSPSLKSLREAGWSPAQVVEATGLKRLNGRG